MSVLFETSLGDLVVDLEVELCPRTCENFLKLSKTYYYNFCSFFNVQKDFIAQTGDPTDLGTGGESIYARLERVERHDPEYYRKRYFPSELGVQKGNQKWLNHGRRGTLSMAVADGKCGSQFFLTLVDGLNELDSKHVVFGRLVEGFDTLEKINEALVDDQGRPLRDIRLRHVIVLDDPFPDPSGLTIPSQSPIEPPTHQHEQGKKILRVGDDEELDEELDPEVVEERRREREARAQALTLEMVGDLPFAEVSPPENILFVCKLNAITRSEDLELIFSRFGTILSCQVIMDPKTGDSLQYAFIEFLEQEDAERAYFKMDGVLIDDRRIHVDFSQSVSKLYVSSNPSLASSLVKISPSCNTGIRIGFIKGLASVNTSTTIPIKTLRPVWLGTLNTRGRPWIMVAPIIVKDRKTIHDRKTTEDTTSEGTTSQGTTSEGTSEGTTSEDTTNEDTTIEDTTIEGTTIEGKMTIGHMGILAGRVVGRKIRITMARDMTTADAGLAARLPADIGNHSDDSSDSLSPYRRAFSHTWLGPVPE
ncbi:peptidylprolyl isomerase [Puccinia sorghi]|uniref:Peptidyl-prolyl cis-trans isomerase n=1 Tax=Puccinia sorghi TaxID=27349 RepID=A0A0L6ULD3_9BASI|nr:peptidylprolyl isomerase [Puccinia sorghi]